MYAKVLLRQLSGNSLVRSIVQAHLRFNSDAYLPPIHHPRTTSDATGTPLNLATTVCTHVYSHVGTWNAEKATNDLPQQVSGG